jgi:hypothetical protein
MAVVIPSSQLTSEVLDYLSSSAKVKGVIVLDDGVSTEAMKGNLSPDSPSPHGAGTPDAAYTIGPNYAWNTHANSLMFQSYNFPIVLATGAVMFPRQIPGRTRIWKHLTECGNCAWGGHLKCP